MSLCLWLQRLADRVSSFPRASVFAFFLQPRAIAMAEAAEEVAKLLCVLCGLLYPPSDKNKALWLMS